MRLSRLSMAMAAISMCAMVDWSTHFPYTNQPLGYKRKPNRLSQAKRRKYIRQRRK